MRSRPTNLYFDYFWPNPPPAPSSESKSASVGNIKGDSATTPLQRDPAVAERAWVGKYAFIFAVRWAGLSIALWMLAAMLRACEVDIVAVLIQGLSTGATFIACYLLAKRTR